MKIITRKNYYIVGGSIIGLVVLITIIKFILAMSQTKALSFTIPREYLELFEDSVKSSLTNKVTYNSKSRNAISTFDFSRDYSVVVYQLNVEQDFGLNEIHVKKPFMQKTTGIVYHEAPLGYYTLKYNSMPCDSINRIDLSFDGDAPKILLSNDNTISYYFDYSKLGMSYNGETHSDVFWDLGLHTDSVPINIVFKKKNKKVYLISLSLNDPSKPLSETVLKEILR